MGYYIDETSEGVRLHALGKARALVECGDATLLNERPARFIENLVCAVNNGPFDALAYCYNEAEFREFSRNDGRHRVWLIVPEAATLSGYKRSIS